jgi:hypothetical protein
MTPAFLSSLAACLQLLQVQLRHVLQLPEVLGTYTQLQYICCSSALHVVWMNAVMHQQGNAEAASSGAVGAQAPCCMHQLAQ